MKTRDETNYFSMGIENIKFMKTRMKTNHSNICVENTVFIRKYTDFMKR